MTTAHTLARHPALTVTSDPRTGDPRGTVPAARRPSRDGGLREVVEASGLSLVRAVPGLALVALVVLKGAGAA